MPIGLILDYVLKHTEGNIYCILITMIKYQNPV